MSVALQMALAIAAGFCGGVLHELTHYATARAVGRTAIIDWREFAEYHEMDTIGDRPVVRREDYLIAGAPVLVGLPIGAFFLWCGVPLWLWFGWWFYSLHGALTNDFRFKQVETPPSMESGTD